MQFDAEPVQRRAEGMMARNRQLVVLTMDGEGGSSLSILQKRPNTVLAQRDLEGTWSENIVQTGTPPLWAGWMHGDVTMDAGGAVLDVPGSSRDSSGRAPDLGGVTLSLTGMGTLSVADWPLLHGTLGGSKDLVVVTQTVDGTPGLAVLQRRSATPFVRDDLVGAWRVAGLSTRGARWVHWVRGTWTVNADGSSQGLLDKSDGTTSFLAGTVTVASYGVFRLDPFAYTHGVVGSDRDLMFLVTTDFQGEHQMLVGMRTD